MIFIYITAVLVSIIFERQERRHVFEESMEYRRMGKEMPTPKPRLPMLESWINVVIGVIIFVLGVGLIWTNLLVMRIAPRIVTDETTIKGLIDWGALVAAGIALVILGLKSVLHHRRLTHRT